MRKHVGDSVDTQKWITASGRLIDIPDSRGRVVHLHFSRWAGCPICNIHLANLRKRASELEAAGIHEVVIFHSPPGDVADLRGDLPFDLVADPEREKYRYFGVEESPFFLLHPRAFWRFLNEAAMGRTAERVRGGILGLPADFIIDGAGNIRAARYGRHADDAMTVDEVLTYTKQGAAMQSMPGNLPMSSGDFGTKPLSQGTEGDHWLTPARILKLLAIGFFYAVLVWGFIRFRGPAGAFSGLQQVVNYLGIIPITFGTIALARRLVGSPPKRFTLAILATGAIAGPIPEGIALGWFPSLYGDDPVIIIKGLAWLLWAIGVGFVIGLQMSRTHDGARLS